MKTKLLLAVSIVMFAALSLGLAASMQAGNTDGAYYANEPVIRLIRPGAPDRFEEPELEDVVYDEERDQWILVLKTPKGKARDLESANTIYDEEEGLWLILHQDTQDAQTAEDKQELEERKHAWKTHGILDY